MAHRIVPRRILFHGLAVVAAPSAVVLLVLVLAGELALDTAFVAFVAIAAVLWWPVRRHIDELARLAERLDPADETSGAERLRLHPALMTPQVANALGDAPEAWRQRLDDVTARHASTEILLEHLPDPVIAIDAKHRVVRATTGASALFGGNPIGRDLSAVLRDPAVLDAAERVVADGGYEEIDFLAGSASETALAARLVGLQSTAPDGTRAVIAVSDVTAARKAEQTRVDFVANASHELRTPLSVLLGCIQTLQGPARDDEEARDRFLGMMSEQTERMTRLVNDLLSLSRIELNEHQPPSQTVLIGPIVGHVADSLQFAARARGMTIEVGDGQGEMAVLGDRDELTQLFQNLVDNAIKYGRAGSPIRVSIGETDGTVKVAVANEGDGIAPEHLPRLTERFYRVDTARSREMGGTGLGLAIVKHIVGRHRGRLDIESEVGVGSTFSVSLPAAPARPEVRRAS